MNAGSKLNGERRSGARGLGRAHEGHRGAELVVTNSTRDLTMAVAGRSAMGTGQSSPERGGIRPRGLA
jgi:hypothetical protein